MSTRNFKVAPFDIDDTLIMHNADPNDPDSLRMDYSLPNDKKAHIYVKPNKAHINFLKNLKVSDFYIIAWSQRGVEWVERVIGLLGLTGYVDLCLTKPSFYVDDKPASEWMHQYYSTNQE